MYIIDLHKILPKEIQDDWITFQLLCDILKPRRLFFSVASYLYLFFDGEKQAVLSNYIDPYHNSVWIIEKIKFTADGNKLKISFSQQGNPKIIQEKVKPTDFESARKFIDYLELF